MTWGSFGLRYLKHYWTGIYFSLCSISKICSINIWTRLAIKVKLGLQIIYGKVCFCMLELRFVTSYCGKIKSRVMKDTAEWLDVFSKRRIRTQISLYLEVKALYIFSYWPVKILAFSYLILVKKHLLSLL